MAVKNVKEKTTMKLELDGGMFEEKQRVSTISYTKIRTLATDEQVFLTGQALSGLQDKALLAVKRLEESALSQI